MRVIAIALLFLFSCSDQNSKTPPSTAQTCTPLCEGKTCGSDGCGGACGSCDAGQTCNNGQCISPNCTPQCAGLSCGDDGCGGSCGACLAEFTCVAGVCQPSVNPTTCEQCALNERCSEGRCLPAYWGRIGEQPCKDSWYDDKEICHCGCGAVDPDCTISDWVMHCPSGMVNPTCNAQGQCEGSCTPQCNANWQCGEDGCGNLCAASCIEGFSCGAQHTCIEIPETWGTTSNRCWNMQYAAGDGCDCECGAYDPDCNDNSQAIYNCALGQNCDASGKCVD